MLPTEILITIITPTFNAGHFIQDCIESVQVQTYKNIEHIIMDGSSSDNTISLVQTAMTRYQNIRLVSEKDQGVYDAMNKGIHHSKSKWLYFLGADDSLRYPETLEKIAAYLKGGYADIIYGNVSFKSQDMVYDHEFDDEKILSRNLCHQSIFYHKSVFMKMGFYDLNFHTEADYAFNLKCWLSGKISHLYIPELIANYADGGLSSVKRDKEFVKNFFSLTIDPLLSGNKTWAWKIHLLSCIYRKAIQRKEYGPVEFWRLLFVRKWFPYRFLAILWLIVSLPFYFSGSKTKSKSSHGVY